jgi:8-oxo-dGTP pyrophosphatase MutT (NUDIX family)
MIMHFEVPKDSRLASRVILIDQDKRVLYLKAMEPKTGHFFWVMPGGGLEPHESFEEAAIREAHEESGCTFSLGPYIWFRRHKHMWNGKPFDQYERFFVAIVSDSTYNPPHQDGYISKHKWWSLDELQSSIDDFAPRNIRNIIVPVLHGEYPEKPFDCGV